MIEINPQIAWFVEFMTLLASINTKGQKRKKYLIKAGSQENKSRISLRIVTTFLCVVTNRNRATSSSFYTRTEKVFHRYQNMLPPTSRIPLTKFRSVRLIS